MAIDRQTVEHVARLARLALTEEEITAYAEELQDVVDFMDKLNEVNTEDVTPMIHVQNQENVFREDSVKESLTIEEVLANAPDSEGDYFKVPSIL